MKFLKRLTLSKGRWYYPREYQFFDEAVDIRYIAF